MANTRTRNQQSSELEDDSVEGDLADLRSNIPL
ncbi:predicted protein [Sclerotinia sclerotiorum 1980 UF-70]|uniref:Uncharacterized protein n=1 Tax=Sclerotinia sclerotiorum (strain ATCC 18683 / 1980 / Ss-1) TaxID=665079 RepID=A7E771_SCLS1|nr:predicted protein [Sclerotinia sclerotiorum 1980 UF-70]EDN96223.1 predicted protein [Sclerotinia sclerotiorum 1980 UF-70]